MMTKDPHASLCQSRMHPHPTQGIYEPFSQSAQHKADQSTHPPVPQGPTGQSPEMLSMHTRPKSLARSSGASRLIATPDARPSLMISKYECGLHCTAELSVTTGIAAASRHISPAHHTPRTRSRHAPNVERYSFKYAGSPGDGLEWRSTDFSHSVRVISHSIRLSLAGWISMRIFCTALNRWPSFIVPDWVTVP